MPINVTIIKKNGKRVPYNSNNVYSAIKKGFYAMRTDCDADIRLIFTMVEIKLNKLHKVNHFCLSMLSKISLLIQFAIRDMLMLLMTMTDIVQNVTE